MKGVRVWLLSFMAAVISLAIVSVNVASAGEPAPLAPLGDPPKIKPEIVKLGRYLFFEERISGDAAINCAHCHDPKRGWANNMTENQDEELSNAYPGSLYFRNAKSPINTVNFADTVYWDGRLPAKSMNKVHVRDHLTETHFFNMDGRIMLERMKQLPMYVKMLKDAYGENAEWSFGKVRNTLRDYERAVLNSKNVPFDNFLKGNKKAIKSKAKKGLDLFKGKAGCINCHNGMMLSDYKPYKIGVPENPKIWNDPVRHITLRSFMLGLGVPGFERAEFDPGYYAVSKDPKDKGKFVTPSLREVTRTAPYMHNGMARTLEDAIRMHKDNPKLSNSEIGKLIAFLGTLAGDEIFDEKPADTPADYSLFEGEDWYKTKN